ncbi:MAG: hypothetical protein K6E91_05965 [Butyrivibrio sp.]|nr:hypothetical protein [Butyrivibrio sp.]
MKNEEFSLVSKRTHVSEGLQEEKTFREKLEEVKKSKDFARKLKEQSYTLKSEDRKWSQKASQLYQKALDTKKKVRANKEQVAQLLRDVKGAEDKVSEIRCMRDTLLLTPQLHGMEEKVKEQFRMELNFAVFVAESALLCLEYITTGEEPDYLHGSYIKRRWNINCDHIDPTRPLAEQIPCMEKCLSEITDYECSKYPFTLAYEKRIPIEQKKELKDTDIEAAFSELLDKKDKYPDLFLEPGIIRIFKYVPELILLFNEVKNLREALSHKLSESDDEKYAKMYADCTAMYNTLLLRHRFMISASVLTSSELVENSPSFKSASYDYSLREIRKVMRSNMLKVVD